MARNTPTLYSISGDYISALDILTDPEADYPADAIADTLEGIEGELQDKAVNVVQYMRNLETTAAAIKDAEGKMRLRRQALENHAARLKSYVHDSMKATGVTKIECPYFSLAVQKNPGSVETDARQLPAKFVSVLVEMPGEDFYRLQEELSNHTVKELKPRKTEIKAAIKGGEAVPGARLVMGTRLAIRGG